MTLYNNNQKTISVTSFNDYINKIDFVPETRLWKAVIINAIIDALKKNNNKYNKINKHQALNWLLQDNYNYHYVCELAGISSNKFRRKIKKIISANE